VNSVFSRRQALKNIGASSIKIHLEFSTLIILVFVRGVNKKLVCVSVGPQRFGMGLIKGFDRSFERGEGALDNHAPSYKLHFGILIVRW
jgi:hypothetical protein